MKQKKGGIRKNSGTNPKYKKGIETKKIHPTIPIEAEKEVWNSINEAVKTYLFKKL